MQTVRRKYTYFISFDGGDNYSQFWPNRGAIIRSKRDKNKRYYRTFCDKITISNKYKNDSGTSVNATVFSTLVSWYFDRTKAGTEIKIRIYNNYTGSAVVKWDGYFSIVTSQLDFDAGYIEIVPLPDDDYRQLMKYMDIEYNIFQLDLLRKSPFVNITSTTEYCFCVHEDDSCFSADEWTYCGVILYSDPDDRHYWDEYNLDPAQPIYRLNKRQRIPFQPYGDNTWTQIGDYWYKAECSTQSVISRYRSFFLISEVIQALLTHIADSYDIDELTYVSQFFLNSDGGFTYNYITGGASANKLPYLMMAQKSDVRFPTASNAASIGMITLGEILDILHGMFNVYWYIDSSGNFRIEHERWFDWGLNATADSSAIDINLTDDDLYSPNYQRGIQKYTYEDVAYNAEEWVFMEAWYDDFLKQRTIEYDLELDGRVVESHNVSSVTTDLLGITANVERVADNGWVIVYCDNTHEIQIEEGSYSGADRINGHLSIANLISNYWRWGRAVLYGTIYGDEVVFLSERRTRKAKVSYKINESDVDDVDPYKLKRIKLITPAYGLTSQDGEVLISTHDLETDVVEMELLFRNTPIAAETSYLMINDTEKILINATDAILVS